MLLESACIFGVLGEQEAYPMEVVKANIVLSSPPLMLCRHVQLAMSWWLGLFLIVKSCAAKAHLCRTSRSVKSWWKR